MSGKCQEHTRSYLALLCDAFADPSYAKVHMGGVGDLHPHVWRIDCQRWWCKQADIWLVSDPILLGAMPIDNEGRVDGEVNIDGLVIPAGNQRL
jgi:hypothetical protein